VIEFWLSATGMPLLVVKVGRLAIWGSPCVPNLGCQDDQV
jgi:hypothetical protein